MDPRDRLVAQLTSLGVVKSAAVRDAFASVPREAFLHDVPAELAYTDRAFEVARDGHQLTSSSTPPSMMALMLEQLGAGPGAHVLEIGTGSGYNTALLSHIVGPSGHVTSIDCDAALVSRARERLTAGGCGNVSVLTGDALSFADGNTYDRILSTVCLDDIPSAWWAQLVQSGVATTPLALRLNQVSAAFRRTDDRLQSVSVACCSFIHRAGPPSPGGTRCVAVEGLPGVEICGTDGPGAVETLGNALFEDTEECTTGVSASVGDYLFGLRLWLELNLRDFAEIRSSLSEFGSVVIPRFVRLGDTAATGVVFAEHGLAALCLADADDAAVDDMSDVVSAGKGVDVRVRQYGDAAGAAARLVASVKGWDAAGRPYTGVTDKLRISAWPRHVGGSGRIVWERTATGFALDW